MYNDNMTFQTHLFWYSNSTLRMCKSILRMLRPKPFANHVIKESTTLIKILGKITKKTLHKN